MLESHGGKRQPQKLQDSGFLKTENGGDYFGGLKAEETRRLGRRPGRRPGQRRQQ